MSALRMLGDRLGSHAFAYGAGSGAAFAFGMVNVVVLTRFLALEEFGRLALLMVIAAVLTIVCSLPAVQGSFGWVFFSGDDDGGDDGGGGDGGERDERERHTGSSKAVALTTALTLTIAAGAAGAAAVGLAAEPLSQLLYGTPDLAGAVALAGIAGGLGAVWRLVSNIPRLERRPGMYLALALLRPIAVLALIVPLVAAGGGIEAAAGGLAAGSALAIVLGIAATRRTYALGFSGADARGILGNSRAFIPIMLSMSAIQQLDLFIVWAVGTEADVARFRVASRIGAGMTYFGSAVFTAWMPLIRTGPGEAAIRESGAGRVGATVLLYFAIGSAWISLAMALFAYELIQIAPAAYSEAALLIPLVALAFMAHSALIAVYRVSPMRNRRKLYVRLLVGSALAFVPLGVLLVSWLGAYGAPLAQLVLLGPSAAILLIATQRGEEPMPVDWRRIVAAFALALACFAAARLASALVPDLRFGFDVAAVAVFGIVAVVRGLVPPAHRDFLRDRLSRSRRTQRPGSSGWLVDGLATVAPEHRRVLELVVRERRTAEAVAVELGIDVEGARCRIAAALRELGGFGSQTPFDDQVVRYLLSPAPIAERDADLRRLWTEGVEPIDVEGMERLLAGLRRLPGRAWGEASAARSAAAERVPLLTLAGDDVSSEASAPSAERDGRER